jgi:hypothetical protein
MSSKERGKINVQILQNTCKDVVAISEAVGKCIPGVEISTSGVSQDNS